MSRSKHLIVSGIGSLALGTAIANMSFGESTALGADDSELQSTRQARSNPILRGTKCWVLDPVVGKETFLELRFLPIGRGHSLFSGQAFRNDGTKPDRVLQMSGSSRRHSFVGDGGVTISRLLVDLHYSFSKTGTDPANAFAETGAGLLGHYNLRLNPSDLSGVFEGRDLVLDWTPPLTGPSATYAANSPLNGYSTIANNYLGGIQCDDSVPGFNNCGTIVPLNNTGSLTLVGNNAAACAAARP